MKSPLIPMSAITGKPIREEIYEYMKGLHDNGIEQIMLYPRSGCELEYLSDEWFDTVGNYIAIAEELGMNIWLYDEFNWPSGHAGGRVTGIPEYRLKSITYKGDSVGRINTGSALHGSLFGEKFFPDLLSEKAVEYFIEQTHEKYFRHFERYFGNVIVGFFTDEPSLSYVCDENSLPYYDGIKDDYHKRYGRDFDDDINSGYEYLCRNVMELSGGHFRRCFIGKLVSWCYEHGILLTGHLMRDDMPYGATYSSGTFLKNLSTISVPGIDSIYTDFDEAFLMCLLGGTEYARGGHGAMAELFALGPCDMSYAKKRAMIYLTSCFGVDHYFLGVSHLDMRGNMKIKDFFSDFSSTQPDFGGMRLLSEDARRAAALAKKNFVPDVYVRYPKTICADRFGTDMDMKPFCEIINALTYRQIQWRFADEDEQTGNIPVIDFGENLEYMFKGITTGDVEEICALTDVDREFGVGENIFVRRYDDGTAVIINLTEKDKSFTYCGCKYDIEPLGVIVLDGSEKKPENIRREGLSLTFGIEYTYPNIARAMYINDETRFEIHTDEDAGVIFGVRNDADCLINGEPLTFADSFCDLPRGIKGLYRVSEPVVLKSGINLVTSGNDYKYMPSVFFMGDFSAEIQSDKICSVTLSKRKREYVPGDRITDFGEVVFSAPVTVPMNAKAIELTGTQLYTVLFINGEPAGEKIYPPYIFELDEKYKGEDVNISIVQRSGISSLFGDVDYFNEHHRDVSWKTTPSSEPTEFGFDGVNLIVNK